MSNGFTLPLHLSGPGRRTYRTTGSRSFALGPKAAFEARTAWLTQRARTTNLAVTLLTLVAVMSLLSNIRAWLGDELFQQPHAYSLSPLSLRLTAPDPRAHIRHLVVVPGHAVYTGHFPVLQSHQHVQTHSEEGLPPLPVGSPLLEPTNWALEAHQLAGAGAGATGNLKNGAREHLDLAARTVKTFLRHIWRGLEVAAEDPNSLLVFSGGQTRPAMQASEGLSYWRIAQHMVEANSAAREHSHSPAALPVARQGIGIQEPKRRVGAALHSASDAEAEAAMAEEEEEEDGEEARGEMRRRSGIPGEKEAGVEVGKKSKRSEIPPEAAVAEMAKRDVAGERTDGMRREARKREVDESMFDRATTEEFAQDSYQNLLFSIARFKEVTGHYPQYITIVGFAFKRVRFESSHRKAIRWPSDRLRYVGIDAEGETGQSYEGERIYSLAPFTSDWYGCHGSLLAKRKRRNPFRRHHPYHVSAPQLAKLFEWCPPDGTELFDGTLPW